MAKLAVVIVVSFLGAVAVAAQEGNNATYLPSPTPPQGSPAAPLSPPTQASPPPTPPNTSPPNQASAPPMSPATMAPPPPSQPTASLPIQASSPPSQPTPQPPIAIASPPIQASPPPPSPPIQVPPPPTASPPTQAPPPVTASAPTQALTPPPSQPVQTPPPPTASPPIQSTPPPTSPPTPSPAIQTSPPTNLLTAASPPTQAPPPPSQPIQVSPPPTNPPTAASPPTQAPPPPTASPPIQAPPPVIPPTASTPPPPPVPPVGLTVDFYRQSCPRAEAIVSEVVRAATASNPGIGGGLIRLAFHDCFVQGCDASVLLDPTPANPQPEKLGIPNYPSLRGYEVIDAAKSRLESACPGAVSCADIVQFAARDATSLLSGGRISYRLPGGRRDGRVSLAGDTLAHLPPPFYTLQQLVDNFSAKGLTADDLVVLSGAHSVGHSHCSSCTGRMSQRLSSPGGGMNPLLAGRLRQQCPRKPADSSSSNDPLVVQDFVTPHRMDNQYYRNVISRNCLFDSDSALLASDQTAQMVFRNAFDARSWEQKFAAAMVKMAAIEVKTGATGEIRKNCRVVNS